MEGEQSQGPGEGRGKRQVGTLASEGNQENSSETRGKIKGMGDNF